MADIQALHDQMETEIAVVEAQIAARQEQVEALQREDEADQSRIKLLRETQTAIAAVLEKVVALGPLVSVVSPPATAAKKASRAPRLKTILLPMLETAGAVGMTVDEIAAHVKCTRGIDVTAASVRVFLYKARSDGAVEKRDDGRWLDKKARPTPASGLVRPNHQDGVRHQLLSR